MVEKIYERNIGDKMQAESIILDVDGTLWDSTELVAKSWNRAIQDTGITQIEVTAEQLKTLFGRTMKEIADVVLEGCSEDKKEKVMELCCRYEHADLENDDCNILYPNVKETIIKLSKTHRVFIVSNCQSGYIEMFLKKTNLTEYVMDIECFGNTGKGKGENIRLIMERNHSKSACYVGDIRGDYEASCQAGIPFILAEYGFGDVPESEWKIKDFSELLNIE
ncbi:HAD family hydrolase [Faecalimonas sp.]